jgi:transglutaminase-like putative cysteine protease
MRQEKRGAFIFEAIQKRLKRLKRAFVITLLLIAVLLISACSFSFSEDLAKPLKKALSSNISGLLQNSDSVGMEYPRDEDDIYTISNSEELFDALQTSLYEFSPDIYLSVKEYEQFSVFWDELLEEGALHSAFQQGQVQIEYDNQSPCIIHLYFSYNTTGIVLQEYLIDDKPDFEREEERELYSAMTGITEEIIDANMTEMDKVIAVHDYLVVNTVYSEEQDKADYLATAYSVLIEGEGQCQGYSEAFTALLMISGVETKVISGDALDVSATYQPHAWNLVKIDGDWYHADVTWDDPIPDTGGSAIHTYLFRSDDYFERDHSWSDLFDDCPVDNPIEE